MDIRTPLEVMRGTIGKPVALNMYDPLFTRELEKLDREKEYLIYCATGNRSGNLMGVMDQMGFKTVYNLSGGIMGWDRQGLPIS